MSYELAISRYSRLVGRTEWPRVQNAVDDEDVVFAFREQASLLLNNSNFRKADDLISMLARSTLRDPGNFLESCETSAMPPECISFAEVPDIDLDVPTDGERGRPLYAVLPTRRVICRANDFDWILRAHVSVTACALQSPRRQAKVWVSFEGVPLDTDPEHRPSKADVAAFFELTEKMEAETSGLLHRAYSKSFFDITKVPIDEFAEDGGQIRVAMADSSNFELSALLDARVGRRSVSELPVEGLRELESLVSNITHNSVSVSDDTLKVADELPGIRGIYCAEKNRAVPRAIIAGIARPAVSPVAIEFLPDDLRRLEKSEATLRSFSAARPLSAFLANREAQRIDHSHG